MSVAEEFTLDFGRPERIGLEEAVYAAGKSPAQIDAILEAAKARGASLLLTRLDADRFAALDPRHRDRIDHCAVSRTGIFGNRRPVTGPPRVAIVAAGTSDVPVAREAERTLTYQGRAATLFADVGVAGLWRLTRRIEEIRAHPVVIVAAGMDAALPSVVGGLVAGAIVAVPTSVGYGVAEGGRAALDAVLASCAPGITVVNIDNGYGAACAALRLLHAAQRLAEAP
ncbi:Pyridinium-3,5-biscarboxylic acid mononucleotide synthase [Methylobacterium crusticola]|uniref:Pyridinium-3,5-biscarboxylic acid mononucleotide synthase n=1 Tax=Methylobacterium crusticola TaxID=1697972 RepID=A0ABQ4QWV7_9HYPH|nr:nickel pincer cofactor biosynthesis protein LarB [Methylobacterium crusticola]GJD49541.1 Pyridinium-3,5-biscarboxylic acid mononucleotide synthase [Methylobacterium crusticola]